MTPVPLAHRSSGTGRPIVWLHGASGPTWDEVTEALAGECRSYVPDLRGYGATSRAGPYGPQISAADVIGLLDHLNAQRRLAIHGPRLVGLADRPPDRSGSFL